MSRQEFIDKYFGKAISKKFLTFIIGTFALFLGKISGSEWIIISTAYIAIEGYTKTILQLKDKIQ